MQLTINFDADLIYICSSNILGRDSGNTCPVYVETVAAYIRLSRLAARFLNFTVHINKLKVAQVIVTIAEEVEICLRADLKFLYASFILDVKVGCPSKLLTIRTE